LGKGSEEGATEKEDEKVKGGKGWGRRNTKNREKGRKG